MLMQPLDSSASSRATHAVTWVIGRTGGHNGAS